VGIHSPISPHWFSAKEEHRAGGRRCSRAMEAAEKYLED